MRGFSLLEIIIAISLLSVGIAGAVELINRTITIGSVVRNQLIAWHLAQEGMEVVHNMRHTNWIEQRDAPETLWDDGLVNDNSCVNFDSADFINAGVCNSESQRRLYLSGNHYVHGAGDATDFLRHMEISDGTDGDGASFKLVKSVVEWRGGSTSAEERLYDWK